MLHFHGLMQKTMPLGHTKTGGNHHSIQRLRYGSYFIGASLGLLFLAIHYILGTLGNGSQTELICLSLSKDS